MLEDFTDWMQDVQIVKRTSSYQEGELLTVDEPPIITRAVPLVVSPNTEKNYPAGFERSKAKDFYVSKETYLLIGDGSNCVVNYAGSQFEVVAITHWGDQPFVGAYAILHGRLKEGS